MRFNRKTPKETSVLTTNTYDFKRFFQLISSVNLKKKLFTIGLFLSLFSTGANLLFPQFAMTLIDTNSSFRIEGMLLGSLILVFIIQLLFSALSSFTLRFVGESTVKALREKIWGHLLELPVSYFDDHKSGDCSSRLVNDTMLIANLVSDQIPNFITGSIQLVGSMIILITMDRKMTSLVFLTIPLLVMIMIPISRTMSKLGRKMQETVAEFNAEVSEKLSEIRLIKASNGEAFEKKNGSSFINKIFDLGIKEAKIEALLQPVITTVMMGVFAGILCYGVVRVQAGSLTSGQLVAFLIYLFNTLIPSVSFMMFFPQVQRVMGATERISQIITTNLEIFDIGKKVDLSGKMIKVQNICFEYTSAHMILRNIDFEAKPNSVIAFVGPSGGGKSTIFALLERFYTPTKGEVRIGDDVIEDINVKSWRSQVGYVSQDSSVFAGSIRENLKYGLDRTLTDQQLWQGLKLACADDFVRMLPNQLDAEIGERGIKLSGGQKQRIAIARAFLRNPKILMLDEATASLDSQSEEKIQEALDHLMKGRTTLVIAHRLSTIVDADHIYFIENGEITGHGSHNDLINTHSLYAQYVNEQLLC